MNPDELPDDLTPEERRELGLDGSEPGDITPATETPHPELMPDVHHGPADPHPDLGISDFFDNWEIYQDPTMTGTSAGVLLGVLGVFIVLRNMVFLSAAVSQTASLGVVLTYFIPTATAAWFGVEIDLFFSQPLVGAFVMTALVTLLVTTGPAASSPRRDALLGIAFLVGSAGTLGLGAAIVADIQDVRALLLGSPVAVVPEDANAVYRMTFLILLLHIWLHRGFREASFDRVGARVRQIPVRVLETILWLSIALAIAVCTRVIGALPTFAYAVAPAWAATRIAPNIPRAMVGAGVLGGVSAFLGYLLSFLWEMPPNALQPLTAIALAALALFVNWLLSRRRGA